MKRALILIIVLVAARLVAAPLSGQVEHPQTPTTGYVDPTAPTYNSSAPMRCTASSTPDVSIPGFTEQNRLALQQAVNDASSTGKWIWIPRCRTDAITSATCPADDTCGYPIPKKGGDVTFGVANIMAIDGTNKSNVTIISDGAVLRQIFDASVGCSPPGAQCQDFWGFKIDNASHWRFIGLVFSQRDITNPSEQDHWLQINTSGSTTVDDVLVQHCRFIEGSHVPGHGNSGDMIRVLGQGLPPATAGYAQRINIIDNFFDHAARAGVGFQRGYFGVNVVQNSFRATTSGTDVHNEPTSDGLIGPLLVTGNLFDRTGAGGGDSVTIPGNSTAAPAVEQMVVDNVFYNGYVSGGNNARTWVSGNTMFWNSSVGGADPSLLFGRRMYDSWFTDNWVIKGPSANEADLMLFTQEYGNCSGGGPSCVLHDMWISGNRLSQYSSDTQTSPAIHVDTVDDVWITDNTINYGGVHDSAVINDSFHGIQFDCTYNGVGVTGYDSGWITGNRITRSLQYDGVSTAGRVYVAILLGSNQPNCKFRHLTIRDNTVKDAINFLEGNGVNFVPPGNLVDGPIVVTGNELSNVSAFEIEGNSAVTTWRSDTLKGETLTTSAAPAASRRFTHLNGAGTYAMPAGVEDGFVKRFTIGSVPGAIRVTLAGFGDGSEIDNIPSTLGSFDVVWDKTSSAWRLLNSRNVTVVP